MSFPEKDSGSWILPMFPVLEAVFPKDLKVETRSSTGTTEDLAWTSGSFSSLYPRSEVPLQHWFLWNVSNRNRFRWHTGLIVWNVCLGVGSHIGAGVSFEYIVKLWDYSILSGWKRCGVKIWMERSKVQMFPITDKGLASTYVLCCPSPMCPWFQTERERELQRQSEREEGWTKLIFKTD